MWQWSSPEPPHTWMSWCILFLDYAFPKKSVFFYQVYTEQWVIQDELRCSKTTYSCHVMCPVTTLQANRWRVGGWSTWIMLTHLTLPTSILCQTLFGINIVGKLNTHPTSDFTDSKNKIKGVLWCSNTDTIVHCLGIWISTNRYGGRLPWNKTSNLCSPLQMCFYW